MQEALSRRLPIFAFAVALICACALTAASDASAEIYSFKSCNASSEDRTAFGSDWEGTGLGSYIQPLNNCPAGIVLDMGSAVPQGTKSVTWFHPRSDSTIKSAEFKYYGGDLSGTDYAYTVRSCAYLCDEVAQLVPGGSSAFPKLVSLTMPPVDGPLLSYQGEASIAIQIECLQAFCPDPPELVVKDFEFNYDDSVGPVITNIETDPAAAIGPSGNTGPIHEVGPAPGQAWVRGDNFRLSHDMEDFGFGVVGSESGVDGKSLVPDYFNACNEPYGARRCDWKVNIKRTIDIRGLADGEHVLRLLVYDGFWANRYSGWFPFFVDNTAPSEPAGLAFSENLTQWGWTATPGLVVSHDDATLDPRNTSHSGFKHATFDLRATPDAPPAVEDVVTDPAASTELVIPHEGGWDVGVKYSDNAGNQGNRAHRFVGFDSDVPEPADPAPLGWISLDALHQGVDQDWTPPATDPELESGVGAYAFTVDDEPLGIPDATPDVLAPKTKARIPSGIGEGHHFAHVRAIARNGKASETVTVPVDVDGSAPITTLHGISTADWLTASPAASISATDALSGVAAIEYGFDGAGALNLVPGSFAPITIPQGARTLSYRAIDVAGNVSPLIERSLKADWTPPAGTFLPRDPTRPNVLSAQIDDAHSGLAAVGMQFRRTDGGATPIESGWRSLGSFETLAAAGAKSQAIERPIPDGELADGSYEFRVAARDVAGNSAGSEPVLKLTLPLRAKPTLSAGIALIGKGSKVNWSGASQDRVVVFGKRAALVGSLLDGARNPIANARILVTTTPQYGIPGRPEAVTTDARGEFVVKLPNGPTRRFDLHFDGDSRAQPIDQTADIRVRAALELRATPSTVRSGRRFWLSGKLLSGSMGLPEGEKTVIIQFRLKDKWVPTIATPSVDSAGRFKVRWDGITAKKSTTVYFRVRAKHEGTWPFLSGSSEALALRIKP